MMYLKKSTAKTLRFGPFLDETDGKTAETGLTISQADIRLSKNGGAFAQTNDSGGATHDENGWYSLQLDATDTNTNGPLMVAIHESGALPVWREFMVVPANVYDSLVGGSDKLEVDTTLIEGSDATDQINAACDTAIGDAEPIDANVTQINGGNTDGYNSILKLKGLDVQAQDADTHAVRFVGNGAGHGLVSEGGDAGHGAWFKGGSTSGNGILASGESESGIKASAGGGSAQAGFYAYGSGADTPGMIVQGNGAGAGLNCQGGNTGHGIIANGGAGGGHGISASALTGTGEYSGIRCAGATEGHGIHATGGDSHTDPGAGAKFEGGDDGTNGGYGIHSVGKGTTGGIARPGIYATGGQDTHGAHFVGDGTGHGVLAKGGDFGAGIKGEGGDTSGSGLWLEASTNGHGIKAQGNGSNNAGIDASGGSGGAGIHASGCLGGHGIHAQGAAASGGDGIHANANSGNGNGFSMVKDGTGKDIDADEIGVPVDLGDGASLADNMTSVAGKTANAGSYDRTTDSQEAIRDRGDAAWASGAITQQNVRDAMLLAPSTSPSPAVGSIDTHLDDLLTNVAALNDLSSADVQSACDAAITANSDIDDILADTNEIQGKLPSGDIADESTLTTIDGKIDTIDGNVDDIEAAVGSPVALDGGAATLAGMLAKMADDNGGADFDATTDSLEKIAEALGDTITLSDTVDGVSVNVLLQKLMSMADGRFAVNVPAAGQTTFYKRDSSTPLFIVRVDSAGRTRDLG